MSRAPGATKQSSKWGALLQQAVAGVESRLDTILSDGNDGLVPMSKTSSERKVPNGGPNNALGAETPDVKVNGLTRSNSNAGDVDRLQGGLARAVVKSGSAGRSDSPGLVSDSSLHSSRSPRNSLEATPSRVGVRSEQRSANENHSASAVNSINKHQNIDAREIDEDSHELISSATTSTQNSTSTVPFNPLQDTLPPDTSSAALDSSQSEGISKAVDVSSGQVARFSNGRLSAQEYEAMLAQIQADYRFAENRRQEEAHSFLERIDSLQSKLQYLTDEVLDSTTEAISAASVGSMEKKIAEKNEKIALLLDEGEKLSKTEMRHLNTIKSLRASVVKDRNQTIAAETRLTEVRRELETSRVRCRRAEEAEREALTHLRALSSLEKENALLRADLESQTAAATAVRAQLGLSVSTAKDLEEQAQRDAVVEHERLTERLRIELARTKAEAKATEERLQSEIRRLVDEAEREKERARLAELDLRKEQSILESKLELLHARAEETSAASGGDIQAKFLRQIEVLQSQYAVASENWQGIESSLLRRIEGLEAERDEFVRKESDMRRKARELKTKALEANEELEAALEKLQTVEHDLAVQTKELQSSREKLRLSECVCADLKADMERERALWEVSLTTRIEEERTNWQQEIGQIPPYTLQPSRTDSPGSYTRKGSGSGAVSVQKSGSQCLTEAILGPQSASGRPLYRHLSSQPLRSPHSATPNRQDSLTLKMQPPATLTASSTPSIQTSDHDEFFEGLGTPASPHRTIDDMMSVSTAGAGPSVQLVERMSGAVRRLESEKAALKDELARLSLQRDEAREQVVTLMRELDQKRAADKRIESLEKDMRDVNERYQTTLEMLGEKSELVEELMADIADLKKIYKELVESTMK